MISGQWILGRYYPENPAEERLVTKRGRGQSWRAAAEQKAVNVQTYRQHRDPLLLPGLLDQRLELGLAVKRLEVRNG